MPAGLDIQDLRIGLRFLLRLPLFVRRRINEDTARQIVEERLRNRAGTFLSLMTGTIWKQTNNPFRRMLKQAGIGQEDLEGLVAREGLEGALKVLFQNGVYLTVDEFKGRRPVVRGSFSMDVSPDLLRNPHCSFHIPARTGGSGGKPTPVLIDLAFLSDGIADYMVWNQGRGADRWRRAMWIVPGGIAIALILEYCLAGTPPQRWFSPLDPSHPDIHPRYRHSAWAMRLGAALAGVRLPGPQYASVERPQAVISWLQKVLAEGDTPHLHSMTSSAVGLCHWARKNSIDLSGVLLTVSGEPFTPARQKVICDSGAHVVSLYASAETRTLGMGCLSPETPDEQHALCDRHVMIQPGPQGHPRGLPPDTLMLTTLMKKAPFIFINYCPGDQARLLRRDCGCALQRVGLSWHLQSIASYEKLTAGGTVLLDSDITRILEKVLPRNFGGAPIDYQLLEQEGPGGEPQLRLLVNPSIGDLDTQRLKKVFLQAVAEDDEAQRLMSLQLHDSDYLKIERRQPLATSLGKILHIRKGTGADDAD